VTAGRTWFIGRPVTTRGPGPMHKSALDKLATFRRAYLAHVEEEPLTVLDVGSAVADPSHESNRSELQNPAWALRGLDIAPGTNVDVVVTEPYDWREVPSGSVDVVTCSQVFEHAEYFWITMLEIARVLKTHGLAFVNAPGAGPLHRYPVDCWRFYDDAFPALARYAGLDLLESQVQWAPAYRKGLQWRDATGIMQRPQRTPEAERERALRIAAAKLSVRPELTQADLDALGAPEAVPQRSAIGPSATRGCLVAREAEVLDGASNWGHRAYLIRRELRSIGQILTRPLRDLRL
jgi:SAM-dependent methyltransferase